MRQQTASTAQPDLHMQAGSDSALKLGSLAIVGGCGHVGLPLGLAFARKGCQVDLIDASAERVALVNSGRMPFHEEGADSLLPTLIRSGSIKASTDTRLLEDAPAVIVTI